MKLSDAKKKIDQIEQDLGGLVDLFFKHSNVPPEKLVVVAIVNDCIDLLKELQKIYTLFMCLITIKIII